ncbi:metallophosphoesterase [Flavobacterium luminosum]|uniref:Metallophosphoesterase n=1 Tax=Flavobacterium luminosum TaxID=2949086 RepID=A0ABT0TQF6_9FLAO|nr:metallophosphoesterase [Flavobacterium sp. HXWNR70]MCL9809294.1 metallophosphoesterase [Flavobacterium sp. HXWNR70]
MLYRFLFLIALLLFVEIYSFQAFRTVIKSKWILYGYLIVSIGVIVFVTYTISNYDRRVGQTQQSLLALGFMLMMLVPKLMITFFMMGEDIYRLFSGISTYFFANDNSETFLPERRRFISRMALIVAAIPFTSLIYGITKGRYNFKVIKQDIFFPDLPEAFHGFTITHISDVHSGSFDNPDKINYAIDLINEQGSDVILFTGDIVNARADEMHPWIDTFNRLKKPAFGKFSVLGNHDYGAYLEWESEAAKAKNFEDIKDLHRQIDFKLLMNEHVKIEKNDQQIALVGVENWGKHFAKLGDLEKASDGLAKEDFKILMSHDPSHWEDVVQHHEKHFHLTLSGHTHGMQFGIEIPGYFKWSLAQYVYKCWAGLYENAGRYIYVNRGFGFHAYPGRVGIMPEITVIRLNKGKKLA